MPNEKKSLSSGYNSILAIRWHAEKKSVDEKVDPNQYRAPLSISSPVSLSNKFEIGGNGMYRFNGSNWIKAFSINADWE